MRPPDRPRSAATVPGREEGRRGRGGGGCWAASYRSVAAAVAVPARRHPATETGGALASVLGRGRKRQFVVVGAAMVCEKCEWGRSGRLGSGGPARAAGPCPLESWASAELSCNGRRAVGGGSGNVCVRAVILPQAAIVAGVNAV